MSAEMKLKKTLTVFMRLLSGKKIRLIYGQVEKQKEDGKIFAQSAMETIKNKCTLTDDELVEKAREWIRKLTKTGGRAWSLSVPADFNRDPDFIFDELCRRFIGAKNTEQQVEADSAEPHSLT